MRKIFYSFLVTVLMLSLSILNCFAETVDIPKKTQFEVSIDQYVESTLNKKGDKITFSLKSPYKVNNVIVLPEGTKFLGEVTHTAKAGWPSRSGVITYKLNSIKLKDKIIPIKAKVYTEGRRQVYKYKTVGKGNYGRRLKDNFHENYLYYNKLKDKPCYYKWVHAEVRLADQPWNSNIAPKPPYRGTYSGQVAYYKDSVGRNNRFVWLRQTNPIVGIYALVTKIIRTPIAFVTPLFHKGENIALFEDKHCVFVVLRKTLNVPVGKNSSKQVEKKNENNEGILDL